MTDRFVTRRRLCQSAGALALGGLAGCTGGDSNDDEPAPTDEQPQTIPEELKLDGTALSSEFPFEFMPADVENPEFTDVVAHVQYHEEHTHWHYQPLQIPLDETRKLKAHPKNTANEVIQTGPDEQYQLAVRQLTDTKDGEFSAEIDGQIASFSGTTLGEGAIVVSVTQDGTVLWETPPLDVAVVEEVEPSNTFS